METTHHTNGHSDVKKAVKAIKHVARKAVAGGTAKKFLRASHRVEAKASAMLQSGQDSFATSLRGLTKWVEANPKAAAGAGIGVGIAVGTLASSWIARAALVGGLAFVGLRRLA